MPTTLRRVLALAALLGAAACDSGTGSGAEPFSATLLSFDGGLAQPYYLNGSSTPVRPLVLTGDTARYRPYGVRCTGDRVGGRLDETTVDCQVIAAPAAIRWTSSNPAVAEVDASTGLARATGIGTVTIRAEADGYVTDHSSVGFSTDDLSASRTFQVRQVARIVIAADSASRDGCGVGRCPVSVDVAPGTQRVRMVPGDVHFFSVRQVIDTNGNDILPEIDTPRGRFAWTGSGTGITVTDGVLRGEGRSLASTRGLHEISVLAGGRRGSLIAEVGGLASARVVNASPASSFVGGRFVLRAGQTTTFDMEFTDSFGRPSSYAVHRGGSFTGPGFCSHAEVSNGTRYAMRFTITCLAAGEAELGLTFGLDRDTTGLPFRVPISVAP
ncbi:MAG TPA: Ig-like domain-containing protein [Longimicrobium sp.]